MPPPHRPIRPISLPLLVFECRDRGVVDYLVFERVVGCAETGVVDGEETELGGDDGVAVLFGCSGAGAGWHSRGCG